MARRICRHNNPVWQAGPGRVLQLLERRRRAAKYGLSFRRARDFRLPAHVRIRDRDVVLALPEESGVKTAFIDIFLDDCYGLSDSAQPSTVLDIGANVGLFSVAARVAFPEAEIHAYEPNADLEASLGVQAAAAGFTYFLEAVGAEAGRASLHVHEDSVLTRTSQNPRGTVTQIAFRTAVERIGGAVGLVKLDCEGAEWEILADEPTWRSVKGLAMEYHLWNDYTDAHARTAVQALGFRIVHQKPQIGSGILWARR